MSRPKMKMHIWVFSYNRGVFLKNCVESIEQCASMCELTVFDDNSTDEETQTILATLAKKHRVMKPEPGGEESKHGGLYANMQSAYESMPDGKLMCCMQDDTQMVRAVSERELTDIDRYFQSCSDAGFIQPAFMRGCNKGSDSKLTHYNTDLDVYYVDRHNRSAGAFYSDIFIANVDRLRGENWSFKPREASNEKQARESFCQLAYLRNPFIAWLPNVPAFRGKVQTWAMRKAQELSNSGYYPLKIMSEQERMGLQSRDVSLLPFAEEFLFVRNGSVPEPWNYYPLQRRKWLKRISNVEVFLRRKLSS